MPSIRAMSGAILAVVGGALMIFGGVANHSFLLSLLDIVGGRIGSLVGGIPLFAILVTIYVVSILIGLGGLTVAAGGILIYARHVTTGRLFIALGGGAGFLGLLISFGYTAFSNGLESALDHMVYWVGLILAILARRIANGS